MNSKNSNFKNIEHIYPNSNMGLSSRQVEDRKNSGYSNIVTDANAVTVKDIVRKNLLTYFNLIFAVLAVLLIIVGQFRALTFFPIIIANISIGIFQQIRSKRTLDKLNMLNFPKATVVRDGKIVTIPASDAVMDDIAVFSAGNQIYADAEVVSGEITVNESLLTGETDEITKKIGDNLMSGSFIVSGKCKARLDKVGDNSYISKLSAQAKASDNREHSKIMQSLNTIVKIVGVIIIPIGAAMFYQHYFMDKLSIGESISKMVAALLGMIPEGLYLLTSVALALSVMKLARRRVVVHEMACIETLSRINVLCVDKTGTITENTMKVNKSITLDGTDKSTLDKLIGKFTTAMSNDNATMDALKEYFTETSSEIPIKVMPFSSVVKYSAVVFESSTYILGAPELLLRENFDKYKEIIDSYALKGFRVLLFGTYPHKEFSGVLTDTVSPLGLILLRNPIREHAADTFKYFNEQGVDIKVISGDNPVTVSEIAKDAGIKNAELYIDANEINDSTIKEAVRKYTVFGRVTPQMKRNLVHALQESGQTVAMTGDGVNDVLALKDADCSVAMASGSEAAANVSQLVLLDSDFSCMPDVVLEGRRVVNNIERSSALFLVKNIFSFLLSVFTLIFMLSYPLVPEQVSLINMFTIGTPAFLLALEPSKKRIEGNFLTNIILKSLPAALTDFIVIGLLVSFGHVFNINSDVISTSATLLVSMIGFLILFTICRPFNKFRTVVFSTMIIGFILCVIFMKWWFGISEISIQIILLLLVFSAMSLSVMYLLMRLLGKIQRIFHDKRVCKR